MRSWRAQGMTQVLRLVYLQHFGGAGGAWNLTPDLLNKVPTDLGTARRAGVKVILRLAYNLPPARVWPPPAPYGDAPVERTLHHIHQLGPILRHNADVIETVQEGFIGLWGEGYYSDYFSNPADPTVVTATNWTDRGRVLRALSAVANRPLTVSGREARPAASGRTWTPTRFAVANRTGQATVSRLIGRNPSSSARSTSSRSTSLPTAGIPAACVNDASGAPTQLVDAHTFHHVACPPDGCLPMSSTGRLDSSSSLVGTGSPFTPPAASHDLTFSGSGQLGWAPGALKPGRGLTCTVT